MEEDKDIDQIIASFLSGNASEQQEKDVQGWGNESETNSFQVKWLQKFWKERSADQKLMNHDLIKSQIWSNYQNTSSKEPKQKMRHLTWPLWGFTAVILLLIIPTIIFVRNGKVNTIPDKTLSIKKIVKKNPPGQKSQIHLPDGSKVWLNAQSSISYKEEFSDSLREVHLVGEAYFEVNHDNFRPFHVRTNDISVAVLGTQFNVSAYEDNQMVMVSLIQGAVKVNFNHTQTEKALKIDPGESISYSKDTQKYNKQNFETPNLLYNQVASWKEGILVFNGQDFQSFIKEIKRWYGVEVKVEGEPPADWQMRGTFKNEYLENILKAISFNKDFAYELEGKKLKLMFN